MISQLKDLLQWTQHESVLTITLLSSHSDSENITYTGVEVWCAQTQGGARQKLNEPAPRLEKQKKNAKTKRHSGVAMVGCALSSRLCVHASGEDGTKKVWDSEQQGVGVCPGWRHFWVGFRCRTFPEQERSTERTRCFKSDTLWASCTPLIRTGKRLFSLLRNTI